nr:uncharacterized protein LOC110072654 [Pogona vitticeps]
MTVSLDSFTSPPPDLSGSPLSIDVGLCRAHCRGPRRRNLHLSDFPGLSKPSSMLDFLRAKKVRRGRSLQTEGADPPRRGVVQEEGFLRRPEGTDWDAFPDRSCPAGSRCEASRLRVEEISLLEGVRQVEVTEGCHCAPQPHKCIRAPAPKTFFPDSPQERTVDVGRCSGPMGTRGEQNKWVGGLSAELINVPFPARTKVSFAAAGSKQSKELSNRGRKAFCLSHRFLSSLWPGLGWMTPPRNPSLLCHSVTPLKQNQAKSLVLRAPKTDGLLCVPTHFDMVLLEGPNGHQAIRTLERCGQRAACYRVPHIRSYLEIVADGTAEKLHKRIKEIDVGRCLGRCPGLLLDNTCRQRDLLKPDNDLFQAEEGVSGHCTPRRYETHTFRSQGGQLRTVLSVQTCGCGI